MGMQIAHLAVLPARKTKHFIFISHVLKIKVKSCACGNLQISVMCRQNTYREHDYRQNIQYIYFKCLLKFKE